MGLTGLDGLEKLQAAVLKLPKFMSRASTDAADLLEDVIERQFSEGIDPYGNPWKELKKSTLKRGRTPPPLTDTGALRAVHVVPLQSAGVLVGFDENYAQYHQTGTYKMDARPLVPSPEAFEQSLWYGAVVEAYSNAILKNGGWRIYGTITASGYPKSPLVVDLIYDQAAE